MNVHARSSVRGDRPDDVLSRALPNWQHQPGGPKGTRNGPYDDRDWTPGCGPGLPLGVRRLSLKASVPFLAAALPRYQLSWPRRSRGLLLLTIFAR